MSGLADPGGASETARPGVEEDGPSPDSAGRELAQGAVRGFAWTALSFGSTKLVTFLATLVLARVLVPEEFGVATAAIVLAASFELILDLGVGAALIQEQEAGVSQRVHTAFTLNLIASAGLTLIGLAAAPLLAAFFQVPGEDALFRAVFCYVLLRGAGQIHDTLLKRELDFKRRMLADVTRTVLRAAVAIPLALAGYGAWALVWGLLASEAGGTVAVWMLVRFRPRFTLDAAVVKPLLRFGLAVVALRALSWVVVNGDYLVVGNLLGPADLGVYAIAYRLPELLIENTMWLFASVAFPVYSRAHRLGMDAFRTAMLRALTLVTLFAVPVGTGLAIIARDAVQVLFSGRWAPAAVPLTLIALTMACRAVGYASGDIFPAIGKPGLLVRIDVPFAALLVAGFIVFARFGLVGIAGWHLAVGVCYGAARLVVAARQVGATLHENLRALWPGVCTGLGIALFAVPVRALTEPGLAGLLATIAAGAVGAVLALLAGARGTFAQLDELVRLALRQPNASRT